MIRATIVATLMLLGCSRTGGGLLVPEASTDREDAHADDASRDSGPRSDGSACAPTGDETCNGRDDDCDGVVDESIPARVCEGGGTVFCVAGQFSQCPRRCEVCIPGTNRVCFLSYCTYWGIQRCASDGRTFGGCREENAPSECSRAARRGDTRELEQCCLDNGYCCKDRHDLDGDGDRAESIGNCDAVTSCGS